MEAQANKAEQKEAATQRTIHTLLDKDNGNLYQKANKKIKTDKVCHNDRVEEQQLTCIISVGHE
eukprot:6140354-Heterocapsa_arctica.AAC.1